MSDFDEEWLTLREPADHTARSKAVTDKLCRWASSQGPLRVVDLGAGTGSNLRYLAPLLGQNQVWQLIDSDPMVLATVPDKLAAWARVKRYTMSTQPEHWVITGDHFSAHVACTAMDLNNELPDLNNGNANLVTASAFLDLASAEWINGLVEKCHKAPCAVLFTLTYNGQVQWQPSHADDQLMLNLLNQHQRRDKGLGPALGPLAGDHIAQRLAATGFDVTRHSSVWHLATGTATIPENSLSLQEVLATGWAEAVVEQDPSIHTTARAWLKQRLNYCRSKSATLSVGHLDVLGILATAGVPD